MKNAATVDKPLEHHLREKRNELIWALSMQDYNHAEIGRIFNMDRSNVRKVVARKPRDYKPKWQKVQD